MMQSQEAFATKLTRDWDLGPDKRKRSMRNGKAFRSPAHKAEAKETARRTKDGSYRSAVPVQFHA